jgi:hypothetical protein
MKADLKISCRKCVKQPEFKKEWACEGQDTPLLTLYRGTPIEFNLYRCPLHPTVINPAIKWAFEYYSRWKEKCLPFGGGHMEQPAIIRDIETIIDTALAELGEQN